MTTRSASLCFDPSYTAGGGAETAIYTVASGVRTILKTILLNQVTGAGINVFVLLGRGSGRLEIVRMQPMANANITSVSMWHVMDAGDTLILVASAAGLRIAASGSELPAP